MRMVGQDLRRRAVRLGAAVGLAAVALAGCATAPQRIPYTQAEAIVAQPPGYENIRVWLDGDTPNPHEFGPTIPPGEAATYLALSGGGGNGAYGAGILAGWTKSGTRPKFTAVSGVSTGALIAPFAFLGPEYDGKIESIYTGGDAESLVQTPDVLKVAFGSSLFGHRGLLGLVSRYVDADMVAALAREHAAGRRLYVVTTNIDAKRGVVWNVGAIAASSRPDRIDLIRKVLAASASVPIAFSPELIDVEANGHTFQEMHADGNVTTAVFTLPLQYLSQQRKTRLSGGSIYILMNKSIRPDFGVVEASTLPIVGASIDTLLTQKTLVDLGTMYSYARAHDVDFNITAIDPAVEEGGVKSFDTAYMRKLYQIGYDTAVPGHFWRKTPPAIGAPPPAAAAPAADVALRTRAARRRPS